MIKVTGKKGAVNVRRKPDLNSDVLEVLPFGNEMDLIEMSGVLGGYRWAKVIVGSEFGYIREDVVTFVEVFEKSKMLSKYFSESEFIKSEKARSLGIKNDFETEEHRLNAIFLLKNVADHVREWLGRPIVCSSGYRNKKVNKSVGGASGSQHEKGEAIDLDSVDNNDNRLIFDFIRENIEFDQLIYEFGNDMRPDWVHVSVKRIGVNRGQVLRAIKKNRRTVYELMK